MYMIEITSGFYGDQFNEAIEPKRSKENMMDKYRERIDLFAREFAEMIMNPPVDNNKNTCMSVKFKCGPTALEKFTDSQIDVVKFITMVVEFKGVMSLSIPWLDNCPFHKLFMKHYNAILDIMLNKSISEVVHDVMHKLPNHLIYIEGWEFFDNNDSLRLKMSVKNPRFSED